MDSGWELPPWTVTIFSGLGFLPVIAAKRDVMPQNEIFLPMAALAFWTFCVLTLVPLRRVRAVNAGKVQIKEFRFGETSKVPGEVSIPNRNYMNLLELPVLFYVVCLMFYETRWVDMPVLWLAWAFVAVRVAHSLVHLTYNNVEHRALIFGASYLIAIAMWGLFLVRMYG